MNELIVMAARQDGPGGRMGWDRFRLPVWPGMTAVDCLKLIAERPVTVDGATVAPVAWECNCMEEVCGACAMRVNGVPRLGCAAFVLELAVGGMIKLEPLRAFPVVRDLVVDRSRMHDQLARYEIGHYQSMGPQKVGEMYPFSRCAACGCCLDACPNVGGRSGFAGAFVMGQLVMNGVSPTARGALMERGGPVGCSGYGLCAKHCPKQIDLGSAIAAINHAVRKKRPR